MKPAIERLVLELGCGTIIVEPAFNRAVFIASYSLESQTMTIDHLVEVLQDVAKFKRAQELMESFPGQSESGLP